MKNLSEVKYIIPLNCISKTARSAFVIIVTARTTRWVGIRQAGQQQNVHGRKHRTVLSRLQLLARLNSFSPRNIEALQTNARRGTRKD
jgi:hypothetical protein